MVQFTSRLRNWLSHGLTRTCKDIYYCPTSKVTTAWSKLGKNVCVCKKQKSFGRNNRFSHFQKKRKLNFAVSSNILVFILVERKTTKAIFLDAFYKKKQNFFKSQLYTEIMLVIVFYVV